MNRIRSSRRGEHTRHVPERTCVACGRVRAKRELIRLVRVDDKRVEVDASGRKAGRGAYLCNRSECWQVALKQGRLERALRTVLSSENREQLVEQGRAIPQGAD